jgi:hypothetical protein
MIGRVTYCPPHLCLLLRHVNITVQRFSHKYYISRVTVLQEAMRIKVFFTLSMYKSRVLLPAAPVYPIPTLQPASMLTATLVHNSKALLLV